MRLKTISGRCYGESCIVEGVSCLSSISFLKFSLFMMDACY